MGKLRQYTDICYGILAFFVMLGSLLGKQKAVIMACILVVCWALTRMISDAVNAIHTLQEVKKSQKK